jgi:hypothetical protein
MRKPQTLFSSGSNRKGLHLIVAINHLGGTFIKESTGTDYKECVKPPKYYDSHGNPYSKLSGPEYADFVVQAIEHFEKSRTFLIRRRRELVVVHDHSPIHTCKEVAKKLEEHKIEQIISPTRSPDLDPLDYSIFGVKKEMHNARVRDLPWEERVEKCKEDIQNAPIHNAIFKLNLRMKACINAKGRHFQHDLNQLNKEGSA